MCWARGAVAGIWHPETAVGVRAGVCVCVDVGLARWGGVYPVYEVSAKEACVDDSVVFGC